MSSDGKGRRLKDLQQMREKEETKREGRKERDEKYKRREK
jgi:hypothetical protein